MPSSTADRIGPIEGIWQSRFQAWCFLPSASSSRLVVKLGPPAHSRFADLPEPLGTMARCIDLLAGTSNGPTPIDRLHPRHDPALIFRDGEITAHQFLQGS